MEHESAGRADAPSLAELDVMEEFIQAESAGKNPDVEEFLGKYCQFAESLRPALVGMKILSAEYRRFQKRYPDVDIEHLLDPLTKY